MADYLPRPDAEYDEWIQRFAAYCEANAAALGLSDGQADTIRADKNGWHNAYVSHQEAQAAARGKRETKAHERDRSEASCRQFARMIQANPDVTDEQRKALGLTVRDDKPTAIPAEAVETSAPPLLRLDWSQRGRCTIHFGPNPGNERKNGLPHGRKGVKLWFHLGTFSDEPPQADDDWRYLADDTRSPYVHVLAGSEPVTVAYRAQYFDTKMRPGPFSDPAEATISA